MIKKSPVLIEKIELGALGFYEFITCHNCVYSGLSKNKVIVEGELLNTPLSKQLIVGNLYHDLISFSYSCTSESDFNEFFYKIIKELNLKYVKFINNGRLGSIDTWSATSQIKQYCLNRIYQKNEISASPVSGSKNLLTSYDNRFKGIPDFLRIDKNTVYITEYKSSSLYKDGKIKADYIDQVIFYSILAKDNFAFLTNSVCHLKSLLGENEVLEFSAEELEVHRAQFVTRYERIQAQMKQGLCNFSSENCISCNKKHICQEFINGCMQIKSDYPIYVISGDIEELTSSYVVLKGKKIWISQPNEIPSKMNIGSAYTFFNLMKKYGELYYIDGSEVYEH